MHCTSVFGASEYRSSTAGRLNVKPNSTKFNQNNPPDLAYLSRRQGRGDGLHERRTRDAAIVAGLPQDQGPRNAARDSEVGGGASSSAEAGRRAAAGLLSLSLDRPGGPSRRRDDQLVSGDLRFEVIGFGPGFGKHLSAARVPASIATSKARFSQSARDAIRSRHHRSLAATAGCNHTIPNPFGCSVVPRTACGKRLTCAVFRHEACRNGSAARALSHGT